MPHEGGNGSGHSPLPVPEQPAPASHHGFTNAIVRVFLESNLSLILMLLAAALGITALVATPREEDPQIVVPLADVYVNFPGHSAAEVEQLVSTPLEKILYQIDGVEYVYSMSREDQAIITVRYYVGEDRERSLVKLYKKIDEHMDVVPPGVTGWVIKPVEIDDVPIVTLTLTSATSDEFALRRVGEELAERLAAVKNLSRAYVVGGQPRTVYVRLNPDRLLAHGLSPLEVEQAIRAANVTRKAGTFTSNDQLFEVETGKAFSRPEELRALVVGVFQDQPVFLKDVATVTDGPAEAASYVRHSWGPAHGFGGQEQGGAGSVIGGVESADFDHGQAAPSTAALAHATHAEGVSDASSGASQPAVTIALAKKKGTNAVWAAEDVLAKVAKLKREVAPDDVEMIVTRNYGLTADEKVNELIEALAVAIVFVIAVITLGLGWRESLIVALAVPVVFGLTLTVNLLAGFTINRVTLFALILSLGLLVDDPIVDVENIARHFSIRRRASRQIVLEAVAEIRPPLITATLAVIVSFLPMFFITGMMGPYMRPMALNVPVAMIMSMVVAFTITPWLAYRVLRHKYGKGVRHSSPERSLGNSAQKVPDPLSGGGHDPHDAGDVKNTFLYKLFYPLMSPLLGSRKVAWGFIIGMGLLTAAAAGLAATRHVPLKMLPFDNKNELLLVMDFDKGTTLERSDAAVRKMEEYLRTVPEVTDITSYVGTASPMDFNGLVRHYYLRSGDDVAEIRINLVGKKSRRQQSHGLGLRIRDDLTRLAQANGARLKIVETPPGPPVLATLVGEVYGQPGHTYEDLVEASRAVRGRMAVEPGVVDVDDTTEAKWPKLTFVTDKEKAALNGVSVDQIAQTVEMALGGHTAGIIDAPGERNPLKIELQLPRALRSSTDDLARLQVKGRDGHLVPLAEIGRWAKSDVDQTIYHKNLQRVVYIFGETAGRAPAEAVVDIEADQRAGRPESGVRAAGTGWVSTASPRPLEGRTFLSNGSNVPWGLPKGIRVDFAGEGEWKITLDVFRDLGLAFGAAMVAIYILLVAQTGSFVIPLVVMLAIPLTVLGIMPGFYLLNVIIGQQVGGYADPVFFTATGMIGMIALAGIVTRDSIILVDFIHLSLKRGRSLFDAIMESRVVRLRPILLTAATAMLSAVPIAIDPIFSGLAWALIFGLLASTIFTLFVIPVAYWLLYANKPGHGLPTSDEPGDLERPKEELVRA